MNNVSLKIFMFRLTCSNLHPTESAIRNPKVKTYGVISKRSKTSYLNLQMRYYSRPKSKSNKNNPSYCSG